MFFTHSVWHLFCWFLMLPSSVGLVMTWPEERQMLRSAFSSGRDFRNLGFKESNSKKRNGDQEISYLEPRRPLRLRVKQPNSQTAALLSRGPVRSSTMQWLLAARPLVEFPFILLDLHIWRTHSQAQSIWSHQRLSPRLPNRFSIRESLLCY